MGNYLFRYISGKLGKTQGQQQQADSARDGSSFNVVSGASSSASETKAEETFYDMVLPCRLHDLCDPPATEDASSFGDPGWKSLGHWKLQVYKGPGEGGHGHVVGILGNYNRGKTWVVGRLSDCTFPSEGMTIRTEGMSFKWIEPKSEDVLWHLAIDTAGFNTPITLDNPGKRSTVYTL